MRYEVLILRRAQKELADLPRLDFIRMNKVLVALADDPRPSGCKKLRDRDGWRIRSGNYRAIYEIDTVNKTVTILHVGNRRDVYS